MHKVCATCKRENPAEAFQCHACRSRAFGVLDPSAEYRATQQHLVQIQRKRNLDEAIESCDHFPGRRHKTLIAVCTFGVALVGWLAASVSTRWVVVAIVCGGVSWLALIIRIETMQQYFLRKRNKLS